MTKPTPPTIDAHSALSVQRGDRTQVGDAARLIEAAHGRLLFDAQAARWLHFEPDPELMEAYEREQREGREAQEEFLRRIGVED